MNVTQKEEVQKELLEKIYKKLIHAMLGPNGEPFGAVGESYIGGLIMAYRIVESLDPKPDPKGDDVLKNYLKK